MNDQPIAITKNAAPQYSWKSGDEWKRRYSKLYSYKGLSLPIEEKEPSRISFMDRDPSTYSSLCMRLPGNDNTLKSNKSDENVASILSPRSEQCPSSLNQTAEGCSRNATLLLDMVRAYNRDRAEAEDRMLDLPKDTVDEDENTSEICAHGLNMRMTDRSISRSRVSRASTRRDMDIPSILAFTTDMPAPVAPLGIPAFQKIDTKAGQEELPRWSIRRSMCPVCSQKWKDRSSIKNVKNSGLKRNTSMDLPSIIAPARLRTSITLGYIPRPALAAVDEDVEVSQGGLRSTSAAWQLTRARKFRVPKCTNSPEATMPPEAAAPLSIKDLDERVTRFLKDEVASPVLSTPMAKGPPKNKDILK